MGKRTYHKNQGNHKGRDSSNRTHRKSSGVAIIPSQNKGLCTMCDVNVWIVLGTNNNNDSGTSGTSYDNDNNEQQQEKQEQEQGNDDNGEQEQEQEQQQQIKWCKGCKNFKLWAAFGEKGHATKCMSCRDRQKEKYALQKAARNMSTMGSSVL